MIKLTLQVCKRTILNKTLSQSVWSLHKCSLLASIPSMEREITSLCLRRSTNQRMCRSTSYNFQANSKIWRNPIQRQLRTCSKASKKQILKERDLRLVKRAILVEKVNKLKLKPWWLIRKEIWKNHPLSFQRCLRGKMKIKQISCILEFAKLQVKPTLLKDQSNHLNSTFKNPTSKHSGIEEFPLIKQLKSTKSSINLEVIQITSQSKCC